MVSPGCCRAITHSTRFAPPSRSHGDASSKSARRRGVLVARACESRLRRERFRGVFGRLRATEDQTVKRPPVVGLAQHDVLRSVFGKRVWKTPARARDEVQVRLVGVGREIRKVHARAGDAAGLGAEIDHELALRLVVARRTHPAPGFPVRGDARLVPAPAVGVARVAGVGDDDAQVRALRPDDAEVEPLDVRAAVGLGERLGAHRHGQRVGRRADELAVAAVERAAEVVRHALARGGATGRVGGRRGCHFGEATGGRRAGRHPRESRRERSAGGGSEAPWNTRYRVRGGSAGYGGKQTGQTHVTCAAM